MLQTLFVRHGDTPAYVLVLRLPSGRRQTVGSAAPCDDRPGPDWSSFRPRRQILMALRRYLTGGVRQRSPELAGSGVAPIDRILLIDERASNVDDAVPLHDVVGSYQANATGRPCVGSFEPNPSHQLVTAAGQPSSWLRNAGFLAFLDRSVELGSQPSC